MYKFYVKSIKLRNEDFLLTLLKETGNDYVYTSILAGHFMHLKEGYESVESVPTYIKYNDHDWRICINLCFQ